MAKTKKYNKQYKFVQKDQQHNQSQARSESFDICNFAYFFYDQYPDNIVRMVAAGKTVDMHVPKGLNDAIKAYRPTSDGRSQTVHSLYQRGLLRRVGSHEVRHIALQVAHPGLIAGMGTARAIPDIEGCIQNGISLDHTTGLPYISGSSIKGSLRSALEPSRNGESESACAHLELFRELLGDDSLDMETLRDIIVALFDNETEFGQAGQPIFFDALAEPNDKSLFTFDFITPHRADEDPFKDPVPLQILKVTPGTLFNFYIALPSEFRVNDRLTLTCAQVQDVFKQLLMTFGVGAKTNLGYGLFCEV